MSQDRDMKNHVPRQSRDKTRFETPSLVQMNVLMNLLVISTTSTRHLCKRGH